MIINSLCAQCSLWLPPAIKPFWIDLSLLPSASSASHTLHRLISSWPPAPTPFSSVVKLDDETLMLFFKCPPFSLAIYLEE